MSTLTGILCGLVMYILPFYRIIEDQCFLVAPFAVEKDISEVLFFEFFQVHPVKLSITFSRTEGPVKKEKRYNSLWR